MEEKSEYVKEGNQAGGGTLRKTLLRLLLLFTSAVLGLILVESFLALTSPFGIDYFKHRRAYERTLVKPSREPLVLYELKRDRRLKAGVVYRTNNIGTRGGPVEIPKPEGVFRILFAGDSITFGWGVAEQDTFVARLERVLNAAADAKRFECVNLSAMGYNTMQETALVRYRGLPAEPDMVCIVFYLNDVFVKGKDEDYVRIEREVLETRLSAVDRFFIDVVSPLTKKAGMYNIHDLLTYLFFTRHYQTYYDGVQKFFRGIDEGFAFAKKTLKDFGRFIQGRGIRFVLLDLAGLAELESLARDHGFLYVSLFDAEIQRSPVYWNSPCDPHPNAEGHAFYAKRIVEGLTPHLDDLVEESK